MKILSIRQPWAYAILKLGKDVENRKWWTPFRGWFYIHAGKKIDMEGYRFITKELCLKLPEPGDLKTGGIVGMSYLYNCISGNQKESVLGYNPWFFGPYGFLLRESKEIEMIPLPGKLGFFDVPVRSEAK